MWISTKNECLVQEDGLAEVEHHARAERHIRAAARRDARQPCRVDAMAAIDKNHQIATFIFSIHFHQNFMEY